MGAFIKVIGRRTNAKKVASYVLKKVDDPDLLVSGLDCDNDLNAVKQMKETRDYFGHDRKYSKESKLKNTEVFHIAQSFDPTQKISPYDAHEIGLEWAEKMFPNHEVLIATHNDKNHVHNHFVINSSNMETGKKTDINKTDLNLFQAHNDNITMNHGFGRFESEKYAEKDDRRTFADDLNQSKGIITHKERVKVALEKALGDNSIHSRVEFENRLKEDGIEPYYFAKDKRIGFKIENEQGEIEFKVGGKKLGKRYSLENIDQTIESHNTASRKKEREEQEAIKEQENKVFNCGVTGIGGINQLHSNVQKVVLAELDESKRGTLEFGALKEPIVTTAYFDYDSEPLVFANTLSELPKLLPFGTISRPDDRFHISISDHVTEEALFSQTYKPSGAETDSSGHTRRCFPDNRTILNDIQNASGKLKILTRDLENDSSMQKAKKAFEKDEQRQIKHSRNQGHEMGF